MGALLGKLVSKKFGVVLGTAAIGLLPSIIPKITEAIDWRIYVVAGVYILANVIQKIGIVWIQVKYGNGGSNGKP